MFEASNYNKGTKYLAQQKYEKALIFLRRQISIAEFKELYINLGNTVKALGNYKLARDYYFKALDANLPFFDGSFGEYDLASSNLGLMAYAFGDDSEAINWYRRALDKNPGLADAIWNYSSALLRQYSSGASIDKDVAWQMYEFRFKRSSPVGIDRSLPMWDGITRVGRLVVVTEQGYGDKIMFGRYLERVREMCAELYVQCVESCDPIFTGYNIVRKGSDVEFAHMIPLCTLAGMFDLCDGEWLRGKFGTREFASGVWDKVNIAVEWAGSPTHTNDRNRSVGAERFVDLKRPGLRMLSFKERGPKGIEYLGTCKDWAETASVLNGVDLLITVDTSVAHMAAALGRPVWLLQPRIETDFRWGHGSKCIWYDSVRIFQNDKGWDDLFRRVSSELDKFILETREKRNLKFINELMESKNDQIS